MNLSERATMKLSEGKSTVELNKLVSSDKLPVTPPFITDL